MSRTLLSSCTLLVLLMAAQTLCNVVTEGKEAAGPPEATGPDATVETVVDDAADTTGGVTKENPLKLIETLLVPAEKCEKASEEDDFIEWTYVGSFLNGTVFATGPFSAVLGHGHVVPGVDKGMRGLCVGSKRQMIIHSDLAYGDEGRPPKIPEKATLIFDVDVIAVRATGGVSDRRKIKLDWVHRVDNCTKESGDGDYIEWKYIGSFLDGKVFDEGTYNCVLGKKSVIYGVEEGMKGLCPGDKRKMVIHSDWGYGEQGTTGIPGGSTLQFFVEVIKVNQDTGMKDEL